MRTIDVLGTKYTIAETDSRADERLSRCDGFCDKTTKEIVITTKTEESDLGNWEWYRCKLLRHEIIHAFLFESGLHENFEQKAYGVSETLIDWLAVQFPKIQKIFNQLKI